MGTSTKNTDKKYVSVRDFKHNPQHAKQQYMQNCQFLQENPKKIGEVKDLIGTEYDTWIYLYTQHLKLKKEKNRAFKKFSNLSFEEMLYAYSYYIELHLVSEKNTNEFHDRNLVYLSVNAFLKQFIIQRDQKTQSAAKPALEMLTQWIADAEKKLNRYRDFKVIINLYAQGEITINILSDENQITPKYLDNTPYKHTVLFHQNSFLRYELNMYIDRYRDELEMGKEVKLNGYHWADITQTIIEDKMDPLGEFFPREIVKKEVIPYYFIRDVLLKYWEPFKSSEFHKSWRINDVGLTTSLANNFFRIRTHELENELGLMVAKFSYLSFPKDCPLLQTLLGNLLHPAYGKNALNYPIFQVGNYIYTNKRWLYTMNMADHIFTYYWLRFSKAEQKKFSDKYEQLIAKILEDQAYNFKAKSAVRYKKDGQSYEIDIVASNEKRVIFGEIKITNVKDYYDSVIKNVANNLIGKASSQLRRLKHHLEDPDVLLQIGITKEDLSRKEVSFLIFSMTPDGIGQSDEFLFVNIFLFDLMLSASNKHGVSMREAYDKIIEEMTLSSIHGYDYSITANQ